MTVAGFLDFVRNVMGINSTYLPDNSTAITYSYDMALEIVNENLNTVAPPVYVMAVYNLAGSYLINWCPDQPGQTYFADIRKQFHISQFVPGVISSTSDEGTSSSLTVPKFMDRFTLADLQQLKDPYGRQYLAIAQQYGPLWGLS